MIDSYTLDKFSDFVTERLFQTADLRSCIGGAGVSLFESISSFGIIAVDESDSGNLGVLFGDKKLSTHPLGLTVLVNVDWDFTVIVIEVLFGFLLFLLLFFGLLVSWGATGVEEDSQVVVSIQSDQLDLGTGVVDIPTVIVEEVNVLIDWWLVLWFVFDFLIKFFSQGVSDSWEWEEWELIELGGLREGWGKDFDHCF